MMKGHRDLNQPLKEFFLPGRCGTPDVFKHLVGVKKLALVEQRNAVREFLRVDVC